MKTLSDLYAEDTTRTAQQVLDLYLAQPPEPRPSSPATFVTYVFIGERTDLFGDNAGNMAGALRKGLTAWCAAPDLSEINPALPNPGQLESVHDRLKGATGVNLTSAKTPGLLSIFTSGIDADHPPILTAEQAAALLAIGYVGPTAATLADAERAIRQHAADVALTERQGAVNEYAGELAAWVDAGEGAMPTFGGGE